MAIEGAERERLVQQYAAGPARLRAGTAPLLRRLTDGAWARQGRHTESGPCTAEDWLRTYAEHLAGHARQIEAVYARWTTSMPGATAAEPSTSAIPPELVSRPASRRPARHDGATRASSV